MSRFSFALLCFILFLKTSIWNLATLLNILKVQILET